MKTSKPDVIHVSEVQSKNTWLQTLPNVCQRVIFVANSPEIVKKCGFLRKIHFFVGRPQFSQSSNNIGIGGRYHCTLLVLLELLQYTSSCLCEYLRLTEPSFQDIHFL